LQRSKARVCSPALRGSSESEISPPSSPLTSALLLQTEKYHKNIHRRGNVPETYKPKAQYSVSPVLIGALFPLVSPPLLSPVSCPPGFFLFVVVGSSFLSFLRFTREGSPPAPER